MPEPAILWEIDNGVSPPDIRQIRPKVMGDLVCEAPAFHALSMAAWPKRSRLIAAAPDLLAACKELLAICEMHGVLEGLGGYRGIDMAKAAIAKAQGGDA
jgi:hypothetical protein